MWDPKVVIYAYGLGHYWRKLMGICILNKGTMIPHGIETSIPLGDPKDI